MDEFNIPIFKKTYDLYKIFYAYRSGVPKQDRYTIWQKSEELLLEILENLLHASQMAKGEKGELLKAVSTKLNFLRIFIRLMKDVKTLDSKKYIVIQTMIDEIGRMLGGWIRSLKSE
ncbi:MAG: diversity-generating retroelement protein Avd [Patescibacteria group bacterium]